MSCSRNTEKPLSENVKLKRQLKITRKNNAILKKKMSHLTLTNEDLKSRLQSLKNGKKDCEKSLQVYKDPNWIFSNMEKICSRALIWSEWSDCSKSCFGMRIRKDKCNDANEEFDQCNDHAACHKSGKFCEI